MVVLLLLLVDLLFLSYPLAVSLQLLLLDRIHHFLFSSLFFFLTCYSFLASASSALLYGLL